MKRLLVVTLIAAMPGACAREERVIGQRSLLGALPGAQSQVNALGPKGPRPASAALDESNLEEVLPDGSKILTSRNGRHLMVHIWNTLKDGDADTFLSQVLSERTRNEYLDRGLNPAQAFDRIREREADIHRLFARMPMGERTPGVVYEPLGGRTFRFKVTDTAAKGLNWTGIDMVLEGGNFRLVWFVTG